MDFLANISRKKKDASTSTCAPPYVRLLEKPIFMRARMACHGITVEQEGQQGRDWPALFYIENKECQRGTRSLSPTVGAICHRKTRICKNCEEMTRYCKGACSFYPVAKAR